MATIEITTFRLVAGTDDGEFVEADKRYQQDVVYAAGIVRRTVARAADGGSWVAVSLWDGDPPSLPVPPLVDAATITTASYETLD